MLRKRKPESEPAANQSSVMSLVVLSKRLEAPEMGLPLAKRLTEMMLLHAAADSDLNARQWGVPAAAVEVADREPNDPEFTAATFLAMVNMHIASDLEGPEAVDFALLAGLFATRFPEYVEKRRASSAPT